MAKGLRAHAVAEARVVLRLDPGHAGAKALVDSNGVSPVSTASPAPVPVAPSATPTEAATTPATILAEALKAYRESRVDDAKRLAGGVLAADPGNADATGILKNLGEEVYRPSPLGVNDVLKDLFEKGILLYRAGAWDEAAGLFQSRVFFGRCRERAEDAKLARSLAQAKEAVNAGRTEEAKAALRNVLAIRPDHAEAKSMLESLGAGPQAEERRRQAKDHFNRGVEAYEQGRWADAVREWELVTTLNPADEEAKKLLRKARGKDTAARKAARARIPDMHEEALRLYQQGKLEDARKLYRRILDLDPADEKAKRSIELIDGKSAP
jgi:tetratricopeptide (TPR) repeat protein